MVKSCLKEDFNFICLTDRDEKSDMPIRFIRVEEYDLDTWWNKVLVFKDGISGPGKNIFFDLDVSIMRSIDLIDDIIDDKLCVVDTFWKDKRWFEESMKSTKDRVEAFIGEGYGNTSVMGWVGNSHNFLVDMLLDNIYKHTCEHYGDDTFINKYAKVKYFRRGIVKEDGPIVRDDRGNRIVVANPCVITHVKSVLLDPKLK